MQYHSQPERSDPLAKFAKGIFFLLSATKNRDAYARGLTEQHSVRALASPGHELPLRRKKAKKKSWQLRLSQLPISHHCR